MKKALIAMAAMFLLVIFPGGGFWQLLSHLIGGGVSETYLYPIYGGIILLAGLMYLLDFRRNPIAQRRNQKFHSQSSLTERLLPICNEPYDCGSLSFCACH